jgi:adenylosuccinate lyase
MLKSLNSTLAKKFSNIQNLTSLSPLDGRYSSVVGNLREYFSESALIKYRTVVEIEWLKFLIQSVFDEKELARRYAISDESLLNSTVSKLDMIIKNFDTSSSEKVKEIESQTNHDVKAVEYYIKSEMKLRNVNDRLYELVHFCCTSEDINNLAWGLILKDSLNYVYHPKLNIITHTIARMAEDYSEIPMISRTHGQPASPTTVGKEFANFAYRVSEQHYNLKLIKIKGKFNGAVGNFNAHKSVLPEVNWMQVSKTFVERLGLEWNPYTTQIENHDSISEVFNSASLINTILIGFSRDMWGYISNNYFKQKLKASEVGSSTMPHKVKKII